MEVTGNEEIFSTIQIEDDECVSKYLDDKCHLSLGTRKNYVNVLKNYSNSIGQLPKVWLEEAKDEQYRHVPMDQSKIKKHLDNFVNKLMEANYAEITITRSFVDVKTFYQYFDVHTPALSLTRRETGIIPEDILTKDELKRAVRNANTRDRAVLLLGSSSGMGIGEMINLKYEDFLKSLDLPHNLGEKEIVDNVTEDPIPTWKIKRKRTGNEYTTFSTPESAYAIIDYLNERKKYSEWLFTGHNRDEQMFEGTLVNAMARLNDKSGLGPKRRDDDTGKESGKRLTTHALRLYFQSGLRKAGMNEAEIKYLLGLKLNSRESQANFVNDLELLKNDYIKAMNELSIEQIKVRTFNEPTVQEMEDKIRELERQINLLKKTKE